MKPTSRSALGFAVARIHRVATTVCHALWRSARPFAALAVLYATIGAATFCSATAAQTIAINFASGKATLGSGNVGFTKTLTENERTLNLGKELSSSLWYASTGSRGTISVKGALETDTTERTGLQVSLTFGASGTWSSSNNKTSGSLIGQLTHGYLDCADGGTQNSVSITGLPTTGYDVAVILSGDGYESNGVANSNAQNLKFSPIAVNGVDYTADETGTYPGDACWGKRDSSTSLTEGVNVLFVRNIMSSTLSLGGYYLNTPTRKGRGTISAVMIFIHGTEGNEAAQTVSATATAESTVFSGTGLTWTNDAPETVTALGPATAATLALPSATSLALNSSVDLQSLVLTGEGSLTFSTFSKGGLSASSTTVGANLDVSAKEFGASLGAVTVAADKTLTLGEDTLVSGVTHGSATSKVIFQGTRALTSVPTWALQTTGSVEFNRPILTSGEIAVGLGGSAVTRTVVFKKDVQASRFVIGNGKDTVTNITQEGGTLTFTASSADMTTDNTTNPAILFGHWPTTNRYELKAGSLTAENGCAVLSWGNNNQGAGYTTTVNIGQSLEDAGGSTALLKVKGLTGHTRQNNVATLTVYPSGTLSVGEWGLTNGTSPNKNIVLEGGTLNAYATTSTTLTNGLKITAPSKVTAATGMTLTIDKVNFTEANSVTLGSETETGVVTVQAVTGATGSFNVAAGSLKVMETSSLGTCEVTVAAGAKLELAIASGEKQLSNSILGAGTIEKRGAGVATLTADSANTLNVSVLEGTLNIGTLRPTTLSIADGTQVIVTPTEEELAAGSLSLPAGVTADKITIPGYSISSITEGLVTFTGIKVWTNTMGDGLWSTAGNWSTRELPSKTETVKVMVGAQTTLTLPESGVAVTNLTVEATTAAGALTLSEGKLTVSGTLTVNAAVTATNSTLAYGTLAIQEGKALSLTVDKTVDEGEPYASGQITGSGTLVKLGAGTLEFTTASGKTAFADGVTVDVQAGKLSLKENNYIAPILKDATLRFAEGASWESYGWPKLEGTVTIEVVGSDNTLRLGTSSPWGVSLAGSGTLVKAGEGTLQLPVKPSDGWSGNGEIRAGTLELLAANNGSSQEGTISGILSGNGKLKIGSGTVTLTGDNTYTGETTIAKGAMVKVSAPGKFGTGEVNIVAGGVVEFYQPGTGSVDHRTEHDYSKLTGQGTLRFTGSSWRSLPNDSNKRFPSTLAVVNNMEQGIVLANKTGVYEIGSLSGSGYFRSDIDGVDDPSGGGTATLKVFQQADTTFTGYFSKLTYWGDSKTANLALTVSGTGTLTLNNTTANAATGALTVEAGASVVLAKAWAGPLTVDGTLAIGTDANPATVTLPQAVTEGADGEIVLPAGANLTLSADSVFSGALTGTGTVTVASAKTLKLQPSEPKLFAGVIAGAGSLVVGNGTAASTVKLTGANTYTGTTTVAVGATLSLAGNGVLSDAFGDGSAVVVNGTLELAAGSYCRRTTGAGTIRVLNDQTFAIGQAALPAGETWSTEWTTGLTGFTGTLALVGNLKLTNAASADYTYAPTGFSVRFEADNQGTSDGQLLCDETGKASFTLAPGCSLSGEGFILCPITFAASSVIEIKAATAATAETPGVNATRISLTKEEAKATITLPSGEGKHILLKADVASNGFLYPATSANVPASVFTFAAGSTLTASTAGVKVYRYPAAWTLSYDVVQVLDNPTVPEGTADGVAVAIRDQAVTGFGVPVSVTTVTADPEKPKVVLEGALFFENVVVAVANAELTYTAKVTYDFGVSAITVKQLTLENTPELCVVVCAKVESSAITGTPATFKESARVQLYLNDKLCDGKVGNGPLATVLTSAIDNSVDYSDKSQRWFAVPLRLLPDTGTSNFTVKVTEATP